MIELTVNGRKHVLKAAPDTPLLWVLRDHLQLCGTKYGCGKGLCGAYTVHIGGRAARSCTVKLSTLKGAHVTTIEGLSDDANLHPVQRAWIEARVPQCGYCQPGFIMSVAAMLRQNPAPTDLDISEQITNLCRCGTYSRIRLAIQRAQLLMDQER